MAGIPKDEGRVFAQDGLAWLFEPVVHASGVELQDLTHENLNSADESASSAGKEEAPPPKDPISIGAVCLTPPSEPPLPSVPASSSTARPPTASASCVVEWFLQLSILGT